MNTKERKACRERLSKFSLTVVKQFCNHELEEVAKLARSEYVDRLVSMLVDDLLGYDEPGWHSVSPMYGAIEYQGVMPQDVRKSGGDRMMIAALRLKNRSEGWQLMELVPPRQLVALLVNNFRERLELTQEEACRPDQWEKMVGLLQLSRFFVPDETGGMELSGLKKSTDRGKESVLGWGQCECAA